MGPYTQSITPERSIPGDGRWAPWFTEESLSNEVAGDDNLSDTGERRG